ncbi:hypothetical protein [Streptomyces sp. NPDC000410]|uniref:DUF7144 family membrane protein n=1 Tax=Streptomyces sp. NPDC000410 TaxID=3154254 RepID=UPI003324BCAF
MSQNTQNTAHSPRHGDSTATWSGGGTLFAGVLMLVTGVLGIVEGIVGLAENDVYARLGRYVFSFDLTTWGWIHLILGIILAVTGWGILSDAQWARVTGIALAALNIVLQFLFLPYQPVWAVFSMAISVFVIWALSTDRTMSAV